MDPVEAHLARPMPAIRRRDAHTMIELMRRATGEEPRMWGTIVGFGQYHYHYPSGRQGDAPAASFAPRRQATTIYLPEGVGAHATQLGRLDRTRRASAACTSPISSRSTLASSRRSSAARTPR
jgi:hypothetical protein